MDRRAHRRRDRAREPGPALTLTEPEGEHHGAESGDEAESDEGSESSEGPSVGNAATDDDVSGATTVGVVGIVLGALGLVTAIFAIATARRRGASPGAAPGSPETSETPETS